MAQSLINQQDTFLHSIGSDHLGTSWARTLCHHLWKIFETFWEQHNQFIHNTPDNSEEKLSQALNQAIINEYSVGPERLPCSRKVYIHHNLHCLLDAPITYRKNWFCMVQLARKFTNISRLVKHRHGLD